MQTIPVGIRDLTFSLERPAPTRARLESVDLLRGLVMVVMALDHVRDYFTSARFDPTDLTQTTGALFLTRWVTHFCAPVFVFLAGTGAYLALSRGRTRAEQARFLVTRGLWLIVLELTVVRLAWTFNLDYTGGPLFVQVIWAIGVSMIVLGGLIYLPVSVIGGIGVAIVAGHNLLDGVSPAALGGWGPLWTMLHVQAPVTIAGLPVLVVYPVLPWIGVMAAGYAFGPVLERPPETRRRTLMALGGALTLAFLVLRAWNGYGEPSRWSVQGGFFRTVLSFLNTTKYPPSLLFLLMTLGPAIMFLAAVDGWRGTLAQVLGVFGRVPLFFYVLHLFLIHALALVIGTLAGFEPGAFLTTWLSMPPGWGYGLPVVFALWGAVILALYPVCRWFAGVKATRRDGWLSYL